MGIVKVTYSLSFEGRKASLLAGGDGHADQVLMVDDPENKLLAHPEVLVHNDGKASVDLGWKLKRYEISKTSTKESIYIISDYKEAMAFFGVTDLIPDAGGYNYRHSFNVDSCSVITFDAPITGTADAILALFAESTKQKVEIEKLAAEMDAEDAKTFDRLKTQAALTEKYHALKVSMRDEVINECKSLQEELKKEVEWLKNQLAAGGEDEAQE